MSTAQREAVSVRMKAYWAKRRKEGNMSLPRKKKPTVRLLAKSQPVRSLSRVLQNKYAILGATIRLRQIEIEREECRQILRRRPA